MLIDFFKRNKFHFFILDHFPYKYGPCQRSCETLKNNQIWQKKVYKKCSTYFSNFRALAQGSATITNETAFIDLIVKNQTVIDPSDFKNPIKIWNALWIKIRGDWWISKTQIEKIFGSDIQWQKCYSYSNFSFSYFGFSFNYILDGQNLFWSQEKLKKIRI